MTKPSETTIDIWIRVSRAHQTILSSIEKSLKDAEMPPLAWYDVLLELDRAGGKGARAFVLKEKLLLPQYGLSRLLNKIEGAGYLERLSCNDDGRGQSLVITQSGKIARKKIWSVYRAAIEHAVGSKLSHRDGEILSKLLVHLI